MSEPTSSATNLSSTNVRTGSFTRWHLGVIGVLTFASLAYLATPTIPLGVPGEWTWARRTLEEIDRLALGLSLLLCAGYWAIVNWGETRLRRSLAGERLLIAGQCLLAFVWLLGMLSVQPDFRGIARSPTVLYYKRTEGYFFQAAFEVRDSREFLHSYRDSIASGDNPDRYLHLGTHPPGLTLLYRGLLTMNQSPWLTESLITSEPTGVSDGFASLRHYPTPQKEPMTQAQEATLWAATLLTLLAAAATCWPIYRLASRMGGPVAGWRAAALWPLVPSLLVFFPKSDLLCPLIGTASCWLWLDGWSRLRWGRCVLAGMGFFTGLMLTLALAPVALLLVIQTILERWARREEFRDRPVRYDIAAVMAAVIGFLIPFGALSLWGRCNLVGIWFQNLQNHAMFYDHNSRSYWTWLFVNPLEAALALGVPLACLVGVGLIRSLRERVSRRISFSQTLAWISVWAFLWLSGKNMGEAARLWIFLAPWPVMTAAISMSPKRHRSTESAPSTGDSQEWIRSTAWGILLILQLFANIWTTAWVDGFHFAELLGS